MFTKKHWTPLVVTSLVLLFGYYYFGREHGGEITPFLKGLTLLQHFGIHYIVGVFFGLVAILGYYLVKHRRANEPIILLFAVLWSHWPDVRFLFRQLPHDRWEVIFFFHTLVDEVPVLFWVFLLADMGLLLIYLKILKKNLLPRILHHP